MIVGPKKLNEDRWPRFQGQDLNPRRLLHVELHTRSRLGAELPPDRLADVEAFIGVLVALVNANNIAGTRP